MSSTTPPVGSTTPSASKGSPPLSLNEGINLDNPHCLPCKVIGSASFIGLGAYTWYSGMSQLHQNEAQIATSGSRWGIGARRLGIQGTAVALVGMGLYRFLFTT